MGDRVAVIGKVEFAYGFKQMTSPQYERIEDGARRVPSSLCTVFATASLKPGCAA